MKSPLWTWLVCGGLLAPTVACASAGSHSRSVRPVVMVNQPRPDMAASSLLIFRFVEPDHAAGQGVQAALECQKRLLSRRTFRVAAQETQTEWARFGDSEEARLGTALDEGKKKGFDYILAAEITDFQWGEMNPTRVGVKLRIIDARTRVTVFFAEHRAEEKPHEKSFMGLARPSVPAAAPQRLLGQVLDDIIDQLQ